MFHLQEQGIYCTVHVLHASLWGREGSPWDLINLVVSSGLEIPRHLDDDGVKATARLASLERQRQKPALEMGECEMVSSSS